jgi:hypothetical protein
VAAPTFLAEEVIRLQGVARAAPPPPGGKGNLLHPALDPYRLQAGLHSPFYGTGRIEGTVKVITVPAPSRIVRLYERAGGRFARETLTDETGAYAFRHLPTHMTFFVVAFDEVAGYNATIADFVVPA